MQTSFIILFIIDLDKENHVDFYQISQECFLDGS